MAKATEGNVDDRRPVSDIVDDITDSLFADKGTDFFILTTRKYLLMLFSSMTSLKITAGFKMSQDRLNGLKIKSRT